MSVDAWSLTIASRWLGIDDTPRSLTTFPKNESFETLKMIIDRGAPVPVKNKQPLLPLRLFQSTKVIVALPQQSEHRHAIEKNPNGTLNIE